MYFTDIFECIWKSLIEVILLHKYLCKCLEELDQSAVTNLNKLIERFQPLLTKNLTKLLTKTFPFFLSKELSGNVIDGGPWWRDKNPIYGPT